MSFLINRFKNNFSKFKQSEKGSQTLEWLGIAAVVVIAVGFISKAFNASFGTKVRKKFTDLLDEM